MKIRISKQAKSYYISSAHHHVTNWPWAYMLEILAGEWIDVETNYLFGSQFNTAGMPVDQVEMLLKRMPSYRSPEDLQKVQESLLLGARIMIESVDGIQGDERIGMGRCGWCGKNTAAAESVCQSCGKSEHINSFEPFLAYQRELYVKEPV